MVEHYEVIACVTGAHIFESWLFLSTERSLHHSASRIAACRRFHQLQERVQGVWRFGGGGKVKKE